MVVWWMLAVGAGMMAGCGGNYVSSTRSLTDPPRPIIVELSKAELRQYVAGEAQLSFKADQLVYDQEAQEITAEGEVELLLGDKLWRERE